jgi:hypothetical protein
MSVAFSRIKFEQVTNVDRFIESSADRQSFHRRPLRFRPTHVFAETDFEEELGGPQASSHPQEPGRDGNRRHRHRIGGFVRLRIRFRRNLETEIGDRFRERDDGVQAGSRPNSKSVARLVNRSLFPSLPSLFPLPSPFPLPSLSFPPIFPHFPLPSLSFPPPSLPFLFPLPPLVPSLLSLFQLPSLFSHTFPLFSPSLPSLFPSLLSLFPLPSVILSPPYALFWPSLSSSFFLSHLYVVSFPLGSCGPILNKLVKKFVFNRCLKPENKLKTNLI